MAPPIAEVRSMYARLAGAASDSVVDTVRTLSPSSLAEAVRDRARIAVPVESGLRRAAWCGLIGSLLMVFVQPFVVRLLRPDDWFQGLLLKILDRGQTWTTVATALVCVGFVAMVFSNAATSATRPGLVGLSIVAVAGTVAGLPALLAIVVALVAAAVFLTLAALFAWLLFSILCSALEST